MSDVKPYTREELDAFKVFAVNAPQMVMATEDYLRLVATARAGLEDRERLDWLESWTKGDTGFCPPGNHGGSAENWLVFREDEARGDRYGRWCDEDEGPTLRAAIDAARESESKRSGQSPSSSTESV